MAKKTLTYQDLLAHQEAFLEYLQGSGLQLRITDHVELGLSSRTEVTYKDFTIQDGKGNTILSIIHILWWNPSTVKSLSVKAKTAVGDHNYIDVPDMLKILEVLQTDLNATLFKYLGFFEDTKFTVPKK